MSSLMFIVFFVSPNYFFAATNGHPKTRIAPFSLTVCCGKASYVNAAPPDRPLVVEQSGGVCF